MDGDRAVLPGRLQRRTPARRRRTRRPGAPVRDAVRAATDRSAAQRDMVTLPCGERMRRVSLGNGYNHVARRTDGCGREDAPSAVSTTRPPPSRSWRRQPREMASEGARRSPRRRAAPACRGGPRQGDHRHRERRRARCGVQRPDARCARRRKPRDDARRPAAGGLPEGGPRSGGHALDSAVPITVLSHFQPLTCDSTGATLGSAGPTNIFASDDPTLPPACPARSSRGSTPGTSRPSAAFAGRALLSGTGTDP